MIEVASLTVSYPRSPRPAVENLTLSVAAGEVFGFIGPNGAGKTTTLRVLAGLLRPTSGAVRVCGVDVASDPAGVRARIGYLPDFFGVYDDLTCREYLAFFAAAQGVPRARREEIVESVLKLVDLHEKADHGAGELSRGMQQRLGLARVLLHEPDVLLLDEPASGLDPRARVEVREILRELGAMGKAVVLSSHVLADIASACTSLGIVEQGRLVFHGPVSEALSRADAGAVVVVAAAAMEGAEALRAALAAAGLDLLEQAADGHVRVQVAVEAGERERLRDLACARVSRAASEAGLSLTHLAADRVDLERAFMTLTAGRLA